MRRELHTIRVVVVVVELPPEVSAGRPDRTEDAPRSPWKHPSTVPTPLLNPKSVNKYGSLDDIGIPEKVNELLKVLPEVLQCMYLM